MTKARVALISTGGTISSIGRDSLDVWEYMDTARKAEPDELLQRFPEVPAAAEIVPVKYRAVGSTARQKRIAPSMNSVVSRGSAVATPNWPMVSETYVTVM